MQTIPSNKIEMIKWIRENTKCSLREAGDMVTKDLLNRYGCKYDDLTVRQLEQFMESVKSVKTGELLTGETLDLMSTVRRFNVRWNTEWTLIPNYELTDAQRVKTYNALTEVLNGC